MCLLASVAAEWDAFLICAASECRHRQTPDNAEILVSRGILCQVHVIQLIED